MIRASRGRRRASLAWLALIVALAAILAWLATIPLLRSPIDGRAGALIGQAAPELRLADLDGRERSIDGGGRAPGLGELLGDELRAVPDRDAGHAAPRRGVSRRAAHPRRRLGRGTRQRRRLRRSLRRHLPDPARPGPRDLLPMGRAATACRATISSARQEPSCARSSARWSRLGWSRSSRSCSQLDPQCDERISPEPGGR